MFVFIPHRGKSNVLVAQRIRSISILRCTGPLVPNRKIYEFYVKLIVIKLIVIIIILSSIPSL